MRPWLRHDFFISYTRLDASVQGYAVRLANRLRERFDVFLDEDGLEAGMAIEELERRVRRSAVLIVLASPRIARSRFVPREVRAAQESRRRLIAVDLERTLKEGRGGDVLQPVFDALSWIDESAGVESGPDAKVVERAGKSLSGLRRRTVRTLLAASSAAGVVLLLASLWVARADRAAQRALAEERATLAAENAYARQIALARDLSVREPTRAASVLDDAAACPPARRELAWSILRAQCELLRWEAPAEWGPQRAANWLSAEELVVLGADGRLRLCELQSCRTTRELALDRGTRLLAVEPRERLLALAVDVEKRLELRALDGSLRFERTFEEWPEVWPEEEEEEHESRPSAQFLDGGATLALVMAHGGRFVRCADGSSLDELDARCARVLEEPNEDAWTALAGIISPTDSSAELFFLCNTQVEEYVESSIRLHSDERGYSAVEVAPGTQIVAGVGSATGRLVVLTEHADRVVGMGGVGFLRSGDASTLLARAAAPPDQRGRRATQALLSRHDLPGQDARALAVAPDGANVYVGCRSGALCRVSLLSGRVEQAIAAAASAPIVTLRLAPGVGDLAAIDASGDLRVWRTAGPRVRVHEPLDVVGSVLSRQIRALVRTPSGAVLYASQAQNPDGGNGLFLRDPRSGRWDRIAVFTDPFVRRRDRDGWIGFRDERLELAAPSIAVAGDGRRALARAYDGDGFVRITLAPDGETEEEQLGLEESREYVHSFCCDPRLEFAAAVVRPLGEGESWLDIDLPSSDELDPTPWRLELLRVGESAPIARLEEGLGLPDALAWSPAGSWIAASFTDGSLRLWNAVRPEHDPMVHAGPKASRARRLAFGTRDELVAALFELDDGRSWLRWIELPSGDLLGETAFEGSPPTRLCLRPDGLAAAVGFRDGGVAIVERASPRVRSFAGDAGTSVIALEYSDDGRSLLRVSVDEDGWGTAALCDGASGQPLLDLEVDGVALDAATLLPHGAGVVGVGRDDRIYEIPAREP